MVAVPVDVYVEDVDERIAAGWTHVRVYSAGSPFLNPFTNLVDAVALVAGQRAYQLEDTDPSPGPWYRWALYDENAPATSTHSDPWRLDTSTLNEVVLAAAQLGGAGFAGVVGADSTTSLLVDQALLDEATGEDFLSHAWVWRPAANEADRLRRLRAAPFDMSAGGLVPVRPWAEAPEQGEAYQVYLLLPPFETAGHAYSWAAAARDGLQRCEFEDKVWIGSGDGVNREFDVGAFLGMVERRKIRRIWLEMYDEQGRLLSRLDAEKRGRYVRTIANGRGQLVLEMGRPPRPDQSVVIECTRRDAELWTPGDITSCPLRLAARATLWKAYEHLNRTQPAMYGTELQMAYAGWLAEYQNEAVPPVVSA